MVGGKRGEIEKTIKSRNWPYKYGGRSRFTGKKGGSRENAKIARTALKNSGRAGLTLRAKMKKTKKMLKPRDRA